MTLPPSQTGSDEGEALVIEARYRVLLTDFSTNRKSLDELIATHTKIPRAEIHAVLQERPAVIADAVTRREAEDLQGAFAGSGANVQIVARSIPGIEDVLDDFLLASGSTSVLLMDRAGFKICERGDSSLWDVEEITGLIAGVFAATKRVASFLGEEDFCALFHPGGKASIFLSLVGERGVLVTQFDQSTTMRIVRLYANETANKLGKVL